MGHFMCVINTNYILCASGLGWFFITGNVNATPHDDLEWWDNCKVPLKQSYTKHGLVNVTGLHKAFTSTPSVTFATNSESDHVNQHPYSTLIPLLWLNQGKSRQPVLKIVRKFFLQYYSKVLSHHSRLYLQEKGGNRHSILLKCAKNTYVNTAYKAKTEFL